MSGKLRLTRAGWAKAARVVAAIDWKQGSESATPTSRRDTSVVWQLHLAVPNTSYVTKCFELSDSNQVSNPLGEEDIWYATVLKVVH